MTDQEALLAAILADPKEDTPRLVYADLLEENAGTVECGACVKSAPLARRPPPYKACVACFGTGHVSDGRRERAEFIRVQVELARIHNNSPKKNSDHNIALRRRERELLTGHFRDWFGQFAGSETTICRNLYRERTGHEPNPSEVGGIIYEATRGFVSALTCSWSDWLAHHEAILKQQPIERVRLTTYPTSPHDRPEANAFEYVSAERIGELYPQWKRIEFELPPVERFGVGGRRESMLIWDEYSAVSESAAAENP